MGCSTSIWGRRTCKKHKTHFDHNIFRRFFKGFLKVRGFRYLLTFSRVWQCASMYHGPATQSHIGARSFPSGLSPPSELAAAGLVQEMTRVWYGRMMGLSSVRRMRSCSLLSSLLSSFLFLLLFSLTVSSCQSVNI